MNSATKITIKNLNELNTFAVNFLKTLDGEEKKSAVVALSGDLGAGKTVFRYSGEILVIESILSVII